jgi:GNAT superfamily N-acetyltransferase
MVIRCAEPDEHAALSDLHRRSSDVWEEDRDALAAHPDALGVEAAAIAEGRVRVAVAANGRLLGFAILADGGAGVCELDDLFVEPAVMRQGIGRALVEDAAARARAAGDHVLAVIAHPRTIPFYERVGFVAGEAEQTRFGPAVRLRRALPS